MRCSGALERLLVKKRDLERPPCNNSSQGKPAFPVSMVSGEVKSLKAIIRNARDGRPASDSTVLG